MFPHNRRLPRATFSTSGQGALRLSSPHFLLVLPRVGQGYAVVISKKTLRRAIDRHRTKRRVIGVLTYPPTLPLPKAVILFPKAGVLTLEATLLRAELTELLSKAAHRQ